VNGSHAKGAATSRRVKHVTAQEFCYWLQGFYEINGNAAPAITAEQSKMIREHLALVFTKRTGRSPGEEIERALVHSVRNTVNYC
jgi:hypothetical protein